MDAAVLNSSDGIRGDSRKKPGGYAAGFLFTGYQ
jgi:hypothetical protein